MNTHRVHWANFDPGTGKKTSGRQDCNSQSAAELARAELQAKYPEAVVTISLIQSAIRHTKQASMRIGPSSPDWQGERRITR